MPDGYKRKRRQRKNGEARALWYACYRSIRFSARMNFQVVSSYRVGK